MTTVLIVEDDADIATMLTLFLEGHGYRVEAAVDGAALPLAAATRPAVALVDINMPGMDGLEVARRLRADERTRAARIVLMSAAHRLADRAHEAPADGLLAKPFDLDRVLELVTRFAGYPPPGASDPA